MGEEQRRQHQPGQEVGESAVGVLDHRDQGLPADQPVGVADGGPEAALAFAGLLRFTAVKGDRLAVVADVDEAVAEVGLQPQLVAVEALQPAGGEGDQDGGDRGVGQQHQGQAGVDRPQNGREPPEGDQGLQGLDTERQAGGRDLVGVLGDALVGVVDDGWVSVSARIEPVVGAAVEPAVEQVAAQPVAPEQGQARNRPALHGPHRQGQHQAQGVEGQAAAETCRVVGDEAVVDIAHEEADHHVDGVDQHDQQQDRPQQQPGPPAALRQASALLQEGERAGPGGGHQQQAGRGQGQARRRAPDRLQQLGKGGKEQIQRARRQDQDQGSHGAQQQQRHGRHLHQQGGEQQQGGWRRQW